MPVGALLLKKTKHPKQDPRTNIFASFGLPGLKYTAHANEALVPGIVQYLYQIL